MGQSHLRKLTLSRETVRDLTKDVLESVEGGKNKPYTAGNNCFDTTDPTIIPCLTC